MNRLIPVVFFFLCYLFFPALSHGVENAPRITDREIIESLMELKVGLVALNKRFDDQNKMIDQRFDDQNKMIDQRFDNQNKMIDQRFDNQNKKIDQRFDNIAKSHDQRFEDINQRISTLNNTMLTLFGAIITLIVALFAYIAWDRRTMLKPISERLERLEGEVLRDLDLRHEEGSLLTRLVKVLHEQAKSDPKLAIILRNFSL